MDFGICAGLGTNLPDSKGWVYRILKTRQPLKVSALKKKKKKGYHLIV